MELRGYQKEAVAAALDFFENGSPLHAPIIVAPTGGGKSVIIAAITDTLKTGVLVLQPSKELLEQNYAKFKLYGGHASIYSASVGVKEIGEVTFATIGSIRKKPEDFAHVRCVLIDECHLVPPNDGSMFMSFLNNLPGAKVVGLTATPFRLKKYSDRFTREAYSQINLLTRERPKFFNHFLHITQIDELYASGYLSPIRYIPMAWEKGELKVNTTGAEFTDESVDQALADQKVYERLPHIIRQSVEKGRKHRLVFVKRVDVAERLARSVPDAACVSAETHKKDRERILTAFKEGKIKTVFNVGVLTIGFDFPALDTIIIARPTMSLAFYMQMLGRGIRPYPGKEDCALVDMCGNINRFGEIEKIQFTRDELGKWVIKNGERIISGVRLDSL